MTCEHMPIEAGHIDQVIRRQLQQVANMTPELNQYSDVSFWYQLNGYLWCRELQFGDAWWLTAPTTPETKRFSQQLFVERLTRAKEQATSPMIVLDHMTGAVPLETFHQGT